MGGYLNVVAFPSVATKSKLKEKIKDGGWDFIITDLMQAGRHVHTRQLLEDPELTNVKLSVVGPSAVQRKWYATVEVKKGRLVVS